MLFSETKKLLVCSLILIFALFVLPHFSIAQDITSPSFVIEDPVIDSGFQTSSSLNFGLGQSLSQIAIGKSTSASFELWSGFQYYFLVKANVLTATPDDSEVDLNWTVPQTYLGANVAGYEVGTGTSSGSYTFEDVGNVTNFTKTGLINGTTYYFIIKAYGPGGTFLVYSNEDSAAPNGVVVPPPPPPGGGGGGYSGTFILNGYGYPNTNVTLLRDSLIVGTATAGANGYYAFTQSSLAPGTYTYGVYGTGADGQTSPTQSFERTVSNAVTTTVSNVVLGPTLKTSHSTIKQGESITFSGYTGPSSPLTLHFTGGQTFTRNVTSTANGFYTYSLDTSGMTKTGYAVYATSVVASYNSGPSFTRNFTVGDANIEPPTPGVCAKRSDLNCDGFVNLVDFSILLYFWEAADISRNPRVDIDKSGDVGLRDLSIMLYDWTG